MSKDKGGKNVKKEKGAKSGGKDKVVSDYKMEGKSGYNKEPTLNVFASKTAAKTGSSAKPK